MAAPNEGTTNIPSDASGRYFVGGWDALNSVFMALRASAAGFLLTIPGKGTAANSAVSATTTSGTLLAANTNRKVATFYNLGPSTAYLKPASAGAVAATDYPLPAGAEKTDDNTTGAWYVITASGTADIRVQEIAN